MKKLALFILFIICMTTYAHAQAYIPVGTGTVEYYDQKTNELRRKGQFKYVKKDNGFEYTETDKGSFDKYNDIVQTIKTSMREKNGLLQTEQSTQTIVDKDGNLLEKVIIRFDYKNKKVIYQKYDGQGKLLKEKKYKIKGPICDSTTFAPFAKAFAINRGDENFKQFYLLSNEPSLYDINVKDLGVVDFEKPNGQTVKAIKIQTIADFGILTGVMAKMVPPTFMYFNAQPPYDFLQYEGLEVGIGSPVITSTIKSFQPAQ